MFIYKQILFTDSLDTTFIDGINTNHLIYTVQPVIEIRSNLNISSFMLKGNMKTNELLNRCYLPKVSVITDVFL